MTTIVQVLQLPEGYTVRKVGDTLKVVKARQRKVVIVKEEKMPKQINISIKPFGSAREQLWIGKVIDGEFSKEKLLYKAVAEKEITAKKNFDGKFGKPTTSEDWDITIPDNFPQAIAKSRWSDPSFVSRHIEYEVLYTPVA